MTSFVLAEDDLDDVLLIRRALRDLAPDAECRVARDGVELLALLTEWPDPEPPTLVLLDINMPRMTGIEFLAHAQASGAMPEAPIVVFSTTVRPEVSCRARALGAVAAYAKPSSFSGLRGLLAELIARHGRARLPGGAA